MQKLDPRPVLDDFDPYVDEYEKAEQGESRVLVKDELYMPVHPSRDWIKCFVTATQQDGFRMYFDGGGRRFLLSAKSFDIGKYLISGYEGFPNVDNKPKCGYIARVERQRDGSFLVCLDYCHLCDQKLGQFCCGRSKTEREVIAKITHSVKRYKKVNMEFKCITVTIPTISKSGTRKVWCPRSFRKVNPSLPNSADVCESLSYTPKMGMKLISKLPEWSEDANNLVVRFQGSGRILVASAKNFLLYEEKYSVLDFAEQSMNGIADPPQTTSTPGTPYINNQSRKITTTATTTAGTNSIEDDQIPLEHQDSISSELDIEAVGGSMKGSPSNSSKSRPVTLSSKNIERLKRDTSTGSNPASPGNGHRRETGAIPELASGEEASRSSIASSGHRSRSSAKASDRRRRSPREGSSSTSPRREGSVDRDDGSNCSKTRRSSSRRKTAGATGSSTTAGADSESTGSKSPKTTPRPSSSSSNKRDSTKDAVERSVLQFGKSTATRFVLDFKYPLSPLQAFGIAISAFASDDISDGNHEVNHMNSPVLSTGRKHLLNLRNRSNTITSNSNNTTGTIGGQYQYMNSPLKSPFVSDK